MTAAILHRPQPAVAERPRARPTIDALTGLRGVAACWIVLYHYAVQFRPFLPELRPLEPLIRQGHLAVDLFFVLSGFVLAYNYADQLTTWRSRDTARFMVLRLARIYPVHLVTLLAVLGMVVAAQAAGAAGSLEAGRYSAGDFVLNLFLLQTWVPRVTMSWNYPSWSISSEMFAYLLFPAACVGLGRLRGKASLWVGLMAAVALTALFPRLWFGRPYAELVRVLAPFASGMFLARLARADAGASARNRVFLGALVVCGTGLVVAAPYLFASPAYWMLLAFPAIIYGLGGGGGWHAPLFAWGPVVYVGEVSYSLYMTHAVVQKPVNVMLERAAPIGSALPVRLLVAVLVLAAVAAAALALYYLVERPSRRYVRRLTRQVAPSPVDGAQAVGAP